MKRHPLSPFFKPFENILTSDEISFAIKFFKEKTYGRNSLILDIGEVNDKLYFIESGILREFSYIDQDQDQTHWLMSNGDFEYIVESFLFETPSKVAIQTIEKTKVWFITRSDLEMVYTQIPAFNVVGRIMTEQYLLKYEQFIQMLRFSPTDRYEWFEKYHANLANIVPLKYIASYLQMHPTTLSDIRKKRAKHKI